MDQKLKHLEFIQGVVNRLASASFRMKGWSVVLASALLVLLVRTGPAEFGAILVFPVLMFWALDGYFLSRERLFRRLYDDVRRKEGNVDLSMDVDGFKSTGRFGSLRDWWSAAWSVTLCPFYVMLALVTVIASCVARHLGGGQ